ncbi:sensor histidine kinase [Paenibacillus sacheonensis]|uniref:Histidine kinase n=1 Tax=Paenibacillus sacheonensis TaxID=742054 RepID=A0A7X4YM65_9BACL|nr:PocR ligand-binding domain-containing protein [Paenibacillus sacheonensis]MBM7563276.1 ligand-binding sensor protein [Paenibacillus sacheonensis]NBC68166.1 hypothetical protein [Paenibacillus sacheonensis]
MEEYVKQWVEELHARRQRDESSRGGGQEGLQPYYRLLDMFMKTTGLNGSILKLNGEQLLPLAELQTGHPDFCKLIQESEVGRQRCFASDCFTTREAIAQEKAVICRCHAGLYDSAIPIMLHGSHVGAFITGQMLFEAPTDETVDEILELVSDLPADREDVRRAIAEVPVVPETQVTAITAFMQVLAASVSSSLRETEAVRREAELNRLLRDTELKMVQAKLQPHFLFNVLNLIAGQAMLEDAPRTNDAVIRLSRLLRDMVKSRQPVVTLRDELRFLETYMQLHCLRFEDRLRYEVDVADAALYDAPIPSLTLQLLAENAVKHGIEPKDGPCAVRVKAWRDGANINILMEDDGVGMRPEIVEGLGLENAGSAVPLSGITMLCRRMAIYYGDAFAFDILSSEGKGTAVTLAYPIDEGFPG